VRSAPAWLPLSAYGVLRMPLALLELPLFIVLPTFYSQEIGMDLALIGGVLFATRLLDACADPLVGAGIDRWRLRFDYRDWIRLGLPVLVLGFAAMFYPPRDSGLVAVWLAATSLVTYVAYSVVSIAYQSWGADIGHTSAERARVTTTREAFGLAGVVAASALLSPKHAPTLVAALVVLSIGSVVALRWAPPAAHAPARRVGGLRDAWRDVFGNRAFRWLLAAFMLNGIATAVPATLVLFFVRDVLGGDDAAAAMCLVSYFLAGALGMPLWVRIAHRFGLRHAWLVGIGFAVLAFVWALGLGRGDILPFLAVCVLTGLALGSDLAMPPALLAALIADAGQGGRREGAYFGVWNLATKLNLAAAAGLALPLLDALDYTPGRPGGTLALSLTYAALPCVLKLAAGLIVLLAPLPEPAPGGPPVAERP
jgi:Na+/melibiose symporter-like transporter